MAVKMAVSNVEMAAKMAQAQEEVRVISFFGFFLFYKYMLSFFDFFFCFVSIVLMYE